MKNFVTVSLLASTCFFLKKESGLEGIRQNEKKIFFFIVVPQRKKELWEDIQSSKGVSINIGYKKYNDDASTSFRVKILIVVTVIIKTFALKAFA